MTVAMFWPAIALLRRAIRRAFDQSSVNKKSIRALGAVLALSFVVLLFYKALSRAKSRDDFRRGVALAALSGCFAVLVHSFFDFTLHTTSNALLFLVLAALATLNGRVEDTPRSRRKHGPQRGTEST